MTAFATPAIPYVDLQQVVVVPARFSEDFPSRSVGFEPFGVLVAIGVYSGVYFALREGRRRNVNARQLTSFLIWIAITGFVSAHVLDIIFYYPGRVLDDPWSLLRIWDGLSKLPAASPAPCWRLSPGASGIKRRSSPTRTWSAVPSPSPGCSGAPAARWPMITRRCGERRLVRRALSGRRAARSGLIEFVFTIPLVVAFAILWRKPRPFGFYLAVMALYYAPLRFVLDFWRARAPVAQGAGLTSADPRYAALTPAQWACIALFLFGIGMAVFLLRGGGRALSGASTRSSAGRGRSASSARSSRRTRRAAA